MDVLQFRALCGGAEYCRAGTSERPEDDGGGSEPTGDDLHGGCAVECCWTEFIQVCGSGMVLGREIGEFTLA